MLPLHAYDAVEQLRPAVLARARHSSAGIAQLRSTRSIGGIGAGAVADTCARLSHARIAQFAAGVG